LGASLLAGIEEPLPTASQDAHAGIDERDDEDPIYKTGIPLYKTGPGHVTIEKGNQGTFERQDIWSSVAYFYLDKPENALPALESPEKRMKGMTWGGPLFDQVK
jgi:hypothetical protein